MTEALDRSDRNQALAVWAGLVWGGPIIPVVVLALNWSKPRSLARRQATIATIMWVVILAIYVPVVVRMMVAGEPDAGFWVVFALVVSVSVLMTIVNLVRVTRATVMGAG